MTNDIRWKQRFSNYKKALKRLNENSQFYKESLIKGETFIARVALEALIKSFELSFELSWQTMKDYITYKGFNREIHGSRDSIKAALQFNLIFNGDIWMDMIEDRNIASHVYYEESAQILSTSILSKYVDELNNFEIKMNEIV